MWNEIEKYLKEKNMNQNQLANKIGIPNTRISEIKTGKNRNPSFNLVCKIADALDVKIDDLARGGIELKEKNDVVINIGDHTVKVNQNHIMLKAIIVLAYIEDVAETDEEARQIAEILRGYFTGKEIITKK